VTDAIYLVSCVARKAATRRRAADLYQSDWFGKARAYVESTGSHWFILSAEHGLLHPDTLVDPYDTALAAMSVLERRQWGARVIAQLDELLGSHFRGEIVFLAGRHYRAPLLGYAAARARVPMAGLGIGQQKAWLAAQLAANRGK
jgi:hypothetical protein